MNLQNAGHAVPKRPASPPDAARSSSDILLADFEVVAEAAEGTAGLRKLILNLAIRGRLSTSLADDDAVMVLLSRAEKDRHQRLARGDARQMEELSTVNGDDVPFGLPATWMWTRIGHAMNLVNGRAFKPKDWSASGLPIVRIQNLNNAAAPFNHCAFEVEPRHHLRPGDFLISWSGTPGTSFGAFIWTGPKGVLNQHIFRAEIYGSAYELGFLRIAINARLDEMIAQAHGGAGLQHITKGKLEAMAIPLPPLAEQKRVVAKVDQLMSLCDELEARQTKTRKTSRRLTEAALQALAAADGPEESEAAWKRVVENFDVIVDRAEKIGELRKAIVALALQGCIVPQYPAEIVAADRVERIQSADACVVQEQVTPLPAAWRWVSLEALVAVGPKNGYSPKGVEHETPVKSLTLTATTSGRFDGRFFKYIDEEIPADSDLWLRDGDVLIQRGNTIDYVGVAAIYRGPPRTFIYPDLMMKVRLTPNVDTAFVHMALNGPAARRFIMSRASGTSGSMPKINQTTVQSIPIPLPPLGEQRRIIAMVEELMKFCDEVEARFTCAEERAGQLVEAVVQELVA